MDKENTYVIYTDASFDDNTKEGTYSIVIMQENKVLKKIRKKNKIQLNNSTECEIFAIFQAFNIINGSLLKKNKAQKFRLNTDCSTARDFFLENQLNFKFFKENQQLLNTIKQTHKNIKKRLSKKDCSLKIKWAARENNKIAHNCAYSAFKKSKASNFKKELILIEQTSFLEILKNFDKKQYKVIIYLIENSNQENSIKKTQSEIAKKLEMPLSSLNKIMQKLIKLDIIVKIKQGEYSLLI